VAFQAIGKEANKIEEDELIGEDEGPIEYDLASDDRKRLSEFIASVQQKHKVSERVLSSAAGVSPHTLRDLRKGARVPDLSLGRLVEAAERLRQKEELNRSERRVWFETLRALREKVGGRNKLAKLMGLSGPYLGRVMRGEKSITSELIEKLKRTS
jgi:transcriptional regulator with XRE-family HTH domain